MLREKWADERTRTADLNSLRDNPTEVAKRIYYRSTKRGKGFTLSRVKMFLAATLGSVLMLAIMAAPALAFHHAFLPGGACGQSENAGSNNPTATSAIKTHSPAQDRRYRRPARQQRNTPSSSRTLHKRWSVRRLRRRAC